MSEEQNVNEQDRTGGNGADQNRHKIDGRWDFDHHTGLWCCRG